jgi:hypothetical protein
VGPVFFLSLTSFFEPRYCTAGFPSLTTSTTFFSVPSSRRSIKHVFSLRCLALAAASSLPDLHILPRSPTRDARRRPPLTSLTSVGLALAVDLPHKIYCKRAPFAPSTHSLDILLTSSHLATTSCNFQGSSPTKELRCSSQGGHQYPVLLHDAVQLLVGTPGQYSPYSMPRPPDCERVHDPHLSETSA